MTTYKIVRKYADDEHPDNNKVICTGLTLAEAQNHCSTPATESDKGSEVQWMDCFYEEESS